MKRAKKSLEYIKMMKLFAPIVSFIAYFALSSPVFAQQAWTLFRIENLIIRIGNFFTFIAGFLLVIAIIWSGILYMTAGGDTNKVEKAKTMFWYSIIAAFIILGVGVILATVQGVIQGNI